jgi:hypothetical protein
MNIKTVYERREFPRFELPEGQLSAELGVGELLPTQTIVRDISLGGVKLDIPNHILDRRLDGGSNGGGTCVVRFLGRDDVSPATARGMIRRVDEHDGRHRIAIEFVRPLESVGALAIRAS